MTLTSRTRHIFMSPKQSQSEYINQDSYVLMLLHLFEHKVNYIYNRLIKPTEKDIRSLVQPETPLGFYYLLRPFRLLTDFISS